MDLLDVSIEFILLLGELCLPVAEILLLLLDNLRKSLVELHHLGLELDAVGNIVLLKLGRRLSQKNTQRLASNLLIRDTSLLESFPSKLNLLHPIIGIMLLDRGVNEVQHAMAHDDLPQPKEVAMVGVVNLSNSPGILPTTSLPSILANNNVMASNDGQRYLLGKVVGQIIILAGGVDLNLVSVDGGSNLCMLEIVAEERTIRKDLHWL